MSDSQTNPLEAMPAPSPVRAADLPWEEWSEGVRFGSRVQRLSPSTRERHVGVLIEELAPGRQSCPLHYHLLEEEHLYVLEGQMTLRLGTKRHPLQAGDYVCFPAGHEEGHALVNEGTAPCRYLVIGENDPRDVCVYPESDKVFFRATGATFARATAVDYWLGEGSDEPLPSRPV